MTRQTTRDNTFETQIAIGVVLNTIINIESSATLFGPVPYRGKFRTEQMFTSKVRQMNTLYLEWLYGIMEWSERPDNVFLDIFEEYKGMPRGDVSDLIKERATRRIKEVKDGGLNNYTTSKRPWRTSGRTYLTKAKKLGEEAILAETGGIAESA